MTADEIFELRRQKRHEEAYEAARQLYAHDKGPAASSAMFWTAIDILRLRVAEGRLYDARKISQALQRLLPNLPDKAGWAEKAFMKADNILTRAEMLDDAAHIKTGKWGEELAAHYLRDKGYAIIDRDWHSGHRDIDIIAIDRDVVVFVEVKTRRNTVFGDPSMAIDHGKRRNLRLAINHYIKSRHIYNPVRFDIITVVGFLGCDNPVINHLEDVQII